MLLIHVLIALLVLLIVLYVVRLVIPMLGLPEPITTIAYLIVGLVGLLYLLRIFGIGF